MSKIHFPHKKVQRRLTACLYSIQVWKVYGFCNISNTMRVYYSNRTGHIRLILIYNALAKKKSICFIGIIH